ncbi:MAG: YlbL family protein [Actinomycetota bacterium]
MRRALQILAPAAALAVCLYAVELPLFVEAPGRARAVLPLIDVDGTVTYESEGRLLLTTVNVGRLSVYEALAAWLDPEAEVIPERDVIPPGQTDQEYERASRSQMDQSKIAAVAVALEALTEYPDEHGPGVIVQDVLPGAPAEGALFPGDLITMVDGAALAGIAELRRAIAAAGAERSLELRVRPVEGGDAALVVVRPARVEGVDRPVIGIATVENFPFEVAIESGSIGGPSAGLMWAIGVTEVLTPEDLTGGRTIAGTGTVDLEGSVGPIGGVRLKVIAAEEAGADTFLLPRLNLGEARGAGERIELVPVSTVDEALGYLEGVR